MPGHAAAAASSVPASAPLAISRWFDGREVGPRRLQRCHWRYLLVSGSLGTAQSILRIFGIVDGTWERKDSKLYQKCHTYIRKIFDSVTETC